MGFYDRNIKNSISLENARLHISCKFIDESFISAKQFMCKIQNVTDRIDTPVTFHFIFRSKTPYLVRIFIQYHPNLNFINNFQQVIDLVVENESELIILKELNFKRLNSIGIKKS